MNELNFARLLGGIDDSLITEAAPKKKIVVKTFPWKYAAIASSIALVFCFLAMALVFSRKDVDTASESADTSVTEETDYEKKIVKTDSSSDALDSETTAQKPNEFYTEIFLRSKYSFEQSLYTKYISTHKEIKKDLIGKEIGEYHDINKLTLKYEKYKNYTIAKTYILKDISSDLAIAVGFIDMSDFYVELDKKYKESPPEVLDIDEKRWEYVKSHEPSEFSVYVNEDYKVSTLYQLGFETNLKENGSYGSAYYYTDGGKTIEFQGLDKQKVWDILFSTGEKCTLVDDPDKLLLNGDFKQKLDISTNIPVLGCENKSISISENGYLFTNILNKSLIFNIGEEKAKNIIDYVKNNCKGYELVYREGDNSQNAENANEQKERSGTDESKTGE